MRSQLPLRNSILAAFVFAFLLFWAPYVYARQSEGNLQSFTATESSPHVTLVIYAQHPIAEDSWSALLAALRANLPSMAAQFPVVDPNPALMRGETLTHTAPVPDGIAVYLRGDCRAPNRATSFSTGEVLGWVLKVGTQIESVIHVECTQIGDELSHRTERMNRAQQTAAMSQAIARVILHEWVHIATQSAAHEKEGINKASFSVNDLILPAPDVERARVPSTEESPRAGGAAE